LRLLTLPSPKSGLTAAHFAAGAGQVEALRVIHRRWSKSLHPDYLHHLEAAVGSAVGGSGSSSGGSSSSGSGSVPQTANARAVRTLHRKSRAAAAGTTTPLLLHRSRAAAAPPLPTMGAAAHMPAMSDQNHVLMARDLMGRTPAMMAAGNGHAHVLHALRELGAGSSFTAMSVQATTRGRMKTGGGGSSGSGRVAGSGFGGGGPNPGLTPAHVAAKHGLFLPC
jgi:ankyrin repeat protein